MVLFSPLKQELDGKNYKCQAVWIHILGIFNCCCRDQVQYYSASFLFSWTRDFFLRAVNGLTANWLFRAYIHEGHFIWGTTCEIQSSVVWRIRLIDNNY